MKAISFRSLALASLASLAMATSSSAVTILQFNQQFPTDSVTAVVVGTTTQLRTSSALDPNSIPVLIGNIGGTTLGTPLPAFETFINVVSTGTATTASTGEIQQLYSGTIAITSGANNTGGNFLTATFQNAVLSGTGNAGGLSGSRPPQNVTFTSNFAAIVPLIAGNPPENFTIGFSGITPGLTITGGTIAGFTARNTGTFDTGPAVVPEPSGIVMAGMALIGGLGFGWRRRQSSRA